MTAEQVAAPLLAVKQTGLCNDVTSMQNWPKFRPFAAFACLPAIVFLDRVSGLANDNMTAALAASSGASVSWGLVPSSRTSATPPSRWFWFASA